MLLPFPAPLLRLEHGPRYYFIPVPEDEANVLLSSGTRRIVGTLNGHPVQRALHGTIEAGCYLVLGKGVVRKIGASLGDMVTVAIQSDPNPDVVTLCDEFAAVLEQDEEAAERFMGMTPGRRRSLAHYVDSAKRVETRLRRAMELAHKLRTRTLYSDRKRED